MVWPTPPSCPYRPACRTALLLAWSLVVIFTTGIVASAQTETTNWYFGDKAGVTFRNGTAESLSDGMISTNEGCAAISDPTTGDLLFYTDGVTVYNRLHEVMAGGTGLNGDASTSQSAIIVPQPGNPFVFYIFNPAPITSSALNGRCYCLWMSVVDLRKQGGFGEVVRKNEQLATDITEHITATKNCAGDGYWIVVRSRSSRHFYAFQLKRDRLETTPVISDAGDPTLSVRDAGQMHISPDSRKLVLTSAAGNSQLFEFDYATGLINNGTTLFPSTIGGSHYGAAFSRDSRKLYVAVSNLDDTIPAIIYQFHLDQLRSIDIVASRKEVARLQGTFSWTPLQLALDGKIYVSRAGKNILSCISNPQNEVDSCGFVDTAVVLTGLCRFGLPNVIGSMLRPPDVVLRDCNAPQADFTADTICAGTCTEFKDKSVGTVATWEWIFDGGMPATSTQRDPGQICYARPGVFPVYLIVSNPYGSDTLIQTITVRAKPLLTIDPVPTICAGTEVALTARGGITYQWSPQDQVSDPTSPTPTVRPMQTTRYSVFATGANGCTDTASVLVRVALPSAGPDAQLCAGGSVRLLARDATSYEWSPATALSSTTVADPVASPATTTVYTVRMKNGACDVTDTVVVTVVDSLQVSIDGDLSVCDGDATEITIRGGSTIAWETSGIPDPTSFTQVFAPSATTTYRFTVASGSCTSSDSVTIIVRPRPSLRVSGAASICPGDTVQLQAATDPNTAIRWSPSQGLDDPTSPRPRAHPTTTTVYYAVARSAQGCERIDSVLLRVDAVALVSAGPDKTVCRGGSVQLSATGAATTYRWEPPTGLSDPTTLSPIATPQQTTTYILTASSGSCSRQDTVVVSVSELSITVRQADTICDGSSIELRAQGAVRYAWSPSTALSDPTVANPIASPRTTTVYTVEGFDQNGCRDVQQVTVVVRPATPVKLRLGTVTSSAGADDAPMRLFIETDERLLPLHIDSLSAEIRFPSSIFLPTSIDKGRMQPGLQGDDRVLFIALHNIDILVPVQRLADINGTILLGSTDTATTHWANARWTGSVCPSSELIDGYIFVNGCFLKGRAFREFMRATIDVGVDHDANALSIDVIGSEVGQHTLRIYATDGRLLWLATTDRNVNDPTAFHRTVDCTSFATGVYIVQLDAPMGVSSRVITLVR